MTKDRSLKGSGCLAVIVNSRRISEALGKYLKGLSTPLHRLLPGTLGPTKWLRTIAWDGHQVQCAGKTKDGTLTINRKKTRKLPREVLRGDYKMQLSSSKRPRLWSKRYLKFKSWRGKPGLALKLGTVLGWTEFLGNCRARTLRPEGSFPRDLPSTGCGSVLSE